MSRSGARHGATATKGVAAAAWRRVCRHCDGVPLAPTVAALRSSGLLEPLASGARVTMGELAAEVPVNRGHLHVALRGLASQGWLTRSGPPARDETAFRVTRRGRDAFRHAASYAIADELLANPAGGVEPMLEGWGLPGDSAAIDHLDGLVVAPLMAGLRSGATLDRDAERVLGHLGWRREGQWTPEGDAAARFGFPYVLMASYRPMLRRVADLLFGDPVEVFAAPADAEETHIDRGLDIEFSGALSESFCIPPLDGVLQELFDDFPLDEQPAFLADTGCGNGALLAGIHQRVATSTRRGRHLETHPLLAVGVDPSPLCRRVTERTLADRGIDHRTLEGDVGHPDDLAARFGEIGLAMTEGLHVSKSVLHDRSYQAPRRTPVETGATGAYVDDRGEPIAPALVVANLVDVLEAWRPHTREFGMVVFESHTAPPEVAAELVGRTWVTAFDLTHGFSGQYPVEHEILLGAVSRAGFTVEESIEVTGTACGHPFLTMTRLTSPR